MFVLLNAVVKNKGGKVMGQGLSCRGSNEHGFFSAVQNGELETVEKMVDEDPSLLRMTTAQGKLSPLHVASANGRIQVFRLLYFIRNFICFCTHFNFLPLILFFVDYCIY